MEREKLIYFKTNVPYPIGIRFFIGDTKGKVLTRNDPYAAIKESDVRDFKRANKIHIMNGLLIETDEPDLDLDTPNLVTDEKAAEIVKNVFALKKTLAEVTSPEIIIKILDQAKLQKRPSKTIELIEKRFAELVPELPQDMQGVE